MSIQSPVLIADGLQQFADSPALRYHSGRAALACVQKLDGWYAFGDAWQTALTRIR